MKKIFIAALAACLCLVMLTVGISAEETVEQVTEASASFDLFAWLQQTLLPNALSYLLAGGVVLLELLPAITKVKGASSKFDSSADNLKAFFEAYLNHEKAWETDKTAFQEQITNALAEVRETATANEEKSAAQSEELQKALQKFAEVASEYDKHLKESEGRLNDSLLLLKSGAERTERMVYIGLTNEEELVKKGIAEQIAAVEEKENEKQA